MDTNPKTKPTGPLEHVTDFKVHDASAATISCSIKSKGEVKGLRVVAYEQKPRESKAPGRFSKIASHVNRKLGEATTDDKGTCEIKYSRGIMDAPASTSKVYLEVYEKGGKAGESAKINIDDVLNIVVEIGFDEPKNMTVITVVNEDGNAVEGAEVFWHGLMRGKTDAQGHFIIKDVKAGDKMAARLLMHENRTGRRHHDDLSNQNWNYRVYTTSARVRHDDNGDNVRVRLHEVNDPAEEQVLTISPDNTQVGFNLVVSFEWDATTEELIYYRDRLFEVSELLYNATDGQFLIEHLVIADDKTFWDDCDYKVYASNNRSSSTYKGEFFGSDEYIYMNPHDGLTPAVWLHELAHYALGLDDEENGRAGCTYLGVNGSGTPFSEGGEKEACIARGVAVQYRSLKICSAHPDNPHVHTTDQGDEDCWTTISKRYNTSPNWKIHTPVSRNAIPGRLPDSGVPIARWTTRAPWETEAASYIPIFGWKPQWHFDDAWSEDELHNFKVRVRYYGELEEDALVFIKDAEGRSICQGTTRRIESEYREGLVQNEGEMIVRGAHKGDTLTITSRRLFIMETIELSGPNLTWELNFEGWTGGSF